MENKIEIKICSIQRSMHIGFTNAYNILLYLLSVKKVKLENEKYFYYGKKRTLEKELIVAYDIVNKDKKDEQKI